MRIAIILFFPFVFLSCKEKNKDNFVYILARNSQTKEGDIVQKYNSFNSNISHIGIALENTNSESIVYNVSYDNKNQKNSSLIKESFADFWNSKNLTDNKLWKIYVSRQEFEKIRYYIDSLEKQTIFFDLDSTTSNGLYCSEFVYNVLYYCSDRFQLIKKQKRLNGIARIIAGCDTLKYYPADFFLTYKDLLE